MVLAPRPQVYFWVSWGCFGWIATTSYAAVFVEGVAGNRKRLAHLPHQAADLYELQRASNSRSLSVWGFLYSIYAAAGVVILAREGSLPPHQLAGSAAGLLLLALAQTALIPSFGLFVLRYVPARLYQKLLLGALLLLFATVVAPMSSPLATSQALAWLEARSDLLLLCPTLWLPLGAQGLLRRELGRISALLPLLALLGAAPALGRSLRLRPWGEIADELNRAESPEEPPWVEREAALDLVRRGEWLYASPE